MSAGRRISPLTFVVTARSDATAAKRCDVTCVSFDVAGSAAVRYLRFFLWLIILIHRRDVAVVRGRAAGV